MPWQADDTKNALRMLVVRMDRATKAIVTSGTYVIQKAAQEAVAKVTGTLAASIYSDGGHWTDTSTYSAQVGPTVVYGRQHELGGPIVAHGPYSLHNPLTGQYFGHAVYQDPHPYMQPAVDANRDQIQQLAIEKWGAAIQGSS